MLKWILAIVGVGLAMAIFGLFVFGEMSSSVPTPKAEYEECLQSHAGSKAKAAECNSVESVWKRTRDDPTSYFTLWLTGFTGALAIIGLIEGLLIYDQIRLGREEFRATHRPELTVRDVALEPVENSTNGEWGMTFTLANRGSGPAWVVESAFAYSAGDKPYALMPTGQNDVGKIRLAPGQARRLMVLAPDGILVEAAILNFLEDQYIQGTVIYSDNPKRGIERRLVFLRHCARNSERYSRTDDPEDEYTD